MSRVTIFLLLAAVFMSFGYTVHRTGEGDPSKIYLVNSTLIRTTPGHDIRFYDIANPAQPREVGRIAMEENSDVAVMGTYMYADRGYDLVVFDISDIARPVAIDTIKHVFNKPYQYFAGDDVEVGGASGCNGCDESVSSDMAARTTVADASSGQGGSLARFVIVGDYLYCVDISNLSVFDISDPARPRYKNVVSVGWNIETIFPSGDHLFIGSSSGMYIYSIDDAEDPDYISEFNHVRSCDPVVVEGNRAYVTLRGGSLCGGYSNQLDILDISDISNPRLVKTVPLDGPYGLTVRDGNVVVCDGSSGVKIVDTRNGGSPQVIVRDITAHDIILRGNLMIVTSESGYHLYDVGDIFNPKKFSVLP